MSPDRPEDGTHGTTPPPDEPPPPPPPPEARRAATSTAAEDDPATDRSRRGWVVAVVVVGVLLLVALLVGLALAGVLSTGSDSDGSATGSEAEPEDDAGADGEPDGGSDGEASGGTVAPESLDVDGLSGRDAALGRLLEQVDASELAMIGFQDGIDEVLGDHAGGDDPEAVLDEVREVAEQGSTGLAEAREELVGPVDDPGVEEVRATYVAHHDVWADYLEAVAEDPSVLGGEDEGAHWMLSINSSAEEFASTLRDEVDGELDDDVREYAEAILDRGFDRGDIEPDA